jgi:hypothetical protein
MAAQDFALQAGERVQVQGYWEDDELKAAQVTRLADGQSITLRDEAGRPAWAGNGRQATGREALPSQGDLGQAGQGQGGFGQGGQGGTGREGAQADGTGRGQAQVDGWITVQGTVTSVDGVSLSVLTDDGQEIVIEGRAWRFAQELGFNVQSGKAVTLLGFYEDDRFEVGQLGSGTGSQMLPIRDESGRPMWAGRGPGGAVRPVTDVAGTQQGELSESEIEALLMALDDEYKAWSTYDAVIADLGAVWPFPNIQKAEEKHIAALMRLFNRYDLSVPTNDWTGNVPSFDSVTQACEAGAQAEIENAALYDQLFSMVDSPDIVQVFTNLQKASQTKHLPAFEQCASLEPGEQNPSYMPMLTQ